ncbi:MAG: formate dehydrogenase subunit gamma, partial [Falsihalocynthiibacter arcticus]
FGFDPLPYPLAPQEEMQYAQLWHAIVSLVLTAIIFAHIYIGSVGMEGAFDAMGSGEVEEQWAREHHSLWVEDVRKAEMQQSKDA